MLAFEWVRYWHVCLCRLCGIRVLRSPYHLDGVIESTTLTGSRWDLGFSISIYLDGYTTISNDLVFHASCSLITLDSDKTNRRAFFAARS